MAIRVDGSTDKLTRATTLPTILSFTLMGWVYIAVDRAVISEFFTLGTGSGSAYYRVLITAARAHQINNGAAAYTGSTLAVATWYHLACTVAGTGAGQFLGYLDGALAITGNGSATPTAAVMSVNANASGNWLNGRFAAFKAYSSVLTANEIKQEMRCYLPVQTANLNAWSPLFTSTDVGNYAGTGVWTVGGTLATEDGPPIPWSLRPRFVGFRQPVSPGLTVNVADTVSLTDSVVLALPTITHVADRVSAYGNGVTTLASAAFTPGTGNLLVVTMSVYTGVGAPTPTVSDTVNGAYTQAFLRTNPSDVSQGIAQYYRNNVAGSVTTITVTLNGTAATDFMQFTISEFTGQDPSAGVLDAANVTATGTSTTPTVVTAALAQAQNAAVGIMTFNGGVARVLTPGAGWTQVAEYEDNSVQVAFNTERRVLTSPSAVTVDWTMDIATGWFAGVGVYKAATGPLSGLVLDSVATLDSVTVTTSAALVAVSDTLPLTDLVQARTVGSLSVSESLAVVEVVLTTGVVLTPPAAESLSLTDAVTLTTSALVAGGTDGVALTETVQARTLVRLSVAETLALGETVLLPGLLVSLSPADSLGLTEAVTLTTTALRVTATDPVGLTDASLASTPFLAVTVTEPLALTDAATGILPLLPLGLIDTVSLSDPVTVIRSLVGVWQVGIVEPLSVGESALAQGSAVRASSAETLALTDAPAGALTIPAVLVAEILSLSETVRAVVPVVWASVSETVIPTDAATVSAQGSGAASAILVDVLTLLDEALGGLRSTVGTSSAVTMGDTIAVTLVFPLVLSEAVLLGEGITLASTASLILFETLVLGDYPLVYRVTSEDATRMMLRADVMRRMRMVG